MIFVSWTLTANRNAIARYIYIYIIVSIYLSIYILTITHIAVTPICSPLFEELSLRYHKTPAQLFYLFLNNLGIIPLSGTQSGVHMKEDVTVLGTGYRTGTGDGTVTGLTAAVPWYFSANDMIRIKESIAEHD